MSTPEPPVTGDQQQPEQGATPAPVKRAPRRTTPKAPADEVPPSEVPAAEVPGVQTPAAKPTTAKAPAAKPTTAKAPAAKTTSANTPAAKTPAAKTQAATAATRKPAARTTARRPATGRSAAKPDDRGDAPGILDAALAAHNASVRESIITAESEEAPPAPTASPAQQRAARHQTTRTPPPPVGDASLIVPPPVEEPVQDAGIDVPEPPTSRTAETQERTIELPAAEEQIIELPAAAEPTTVLPAADEPTTELLSPPAGPATEFPPPHASAAGEAPGALPEPGVTAHPRSVTDFADRLDDTRFFGSLFDFTFTNYVTRKLAGPVYVVGLVLIGLSTLLSIVYSLTSALNTHSFLGAFVFLFGVIITVVGAMLAVLLLRVGIEVFVAIIEIAQNTRGRKKPRP